MCFRIRGFWHRWKRQSSKTCWCPGEVTNSFDSYPIVWNMNFIFPNIGNNNPNWLIFSGVETTNQLLLKNMNIRSTPCTAVISCRVHRQSDENFRCKAGPGILCQGQDISREAGSGWASFGETASRQEKSSRSLAGAPKSQSYLSWVMSYRLSYAGWWFGTCFSICWE